MDVNQFKSNKYSSPSTQCLNLHLHITHNPTSKPKSNHLYAQFSIYSINVNSLKAHNYSIGCSTLELSQPYCRAHAKHSNSQFEESDFSDRAYSYTYSSIYVVMYNSIHSTYTLCAALI